MTPRRTGIFLATLVILIDFGFVATKLVEKYLSPSRNFGLYDFFHVGREANLPTFLSVMLLLAAAVLLAMIARYHSRSASGSKWPWVVLAAGFLFLCVDEAAQIHEGIIGPISRSIIGAKEGIWYFGWYIPFIPLVVLLTFIFIPFLKRLPSRYMVLFVASAALYIGGAIGVEMIQSWISFNEIQGGAMSLSLLIEETMEMSGIVLFIYGLLDHMEDSDIGFILKIHSSTGS